MANQFVQVRLQSGTRHLTAWVDDMPGVKAGNSLTLKGDEPGRRWDILAVGSGRQTARDLDRHRSWENNI